MTIRMEFEEAPTTGAMMLRAAVSRKPGLKEGDSVERFEAEINGVPVTQLTEYQSICGFTESQIVPLTMPQVIAAPLHMAVLTHPSFPSVGTLLFGHVSQSSGEVLPGAFVY